MKEFFIGVVLALAVLAAVFGVMYLLAYSSDENRQDCEAQVQQAEQNGARATCVVVTR